MSQTDAAAKEKKSFKMPHTFVLLISILIIAVVITWIIPSGSYVRETNEAGIKVVIPDQFEFTEKTMIHMWDSPSLIVKGISDQAVLIFMTLFVGGAFNVLVKSGALHAVLRMVIRKFGNKESLFIPILMLVCGLIATTQSVTIFIAFTPLIIMLVKAMGFDSLTGAAIPLMGGAIGFSTGTLNASSTGIAQTIAELPMFSGIGFRFVMFFTFWIVSAFMLVRYAKKVKKNPEISAMYDLDKAASAAEETFEDDGSSITVRQILCLLSLVGALVILCYGCVTWGWGTKDISIVFIWLAVICGLCAGFSPSTIAKYFVDGSKSYVQTAFVIGIAKGIANVFAASGCLDTVVYGLSAMMNAMPTPLKGASMYWANLIINIPITSASGQAGAVMPIFIPVGDLIGITRQTTVTAYHLGDGFCNYILPWSSALMGNLAVANIPYDRWIKFFWKMFLVWVAMSTAFVMIAQMINYGPF